MIESGPHSAQHVASQPNSVMKLLLKKGLVNDLARVPHSLDLASPNFVATVNSLLKPLEKLSGVVNQQSSGVPAPVAGRERVAGGEEQSTGAQGAAVDSEPQQASSVGRRQLLVFPQLFPFSKVNTFDLQYRKIPVISPPTYKPIRL